MKKAITIGMDLGDKNHTVCILDAEGKKIEEMSILCTDRAARALFACYRGAVVAVETGTHSRWVSQVAKEEGLKVLVGNARKLRMIWSSRRSRMYGMPRCSRASRGSILNCCIRSGIEAPRRKRTWF